MMHYIYHSRHIRGKEYEFTGREECGCPKKENHWDESDFVSTEVES